MSILGRVTFEKNNLLHLKKWRILQNHLTLRACKVEITPELKLFYQSKRSEFSGYFKHL